MAEEQFDSKKQSGENLGATEMNNVFAVCGRIAKSGPGSSMTGVQGRDFISFGGSPPYFQYIVEITNTVKNSNEEDIEGMFLCSSRFYNPGTSTDKNQGEWRTNTTHEWLLDTRGADQTLSIGDKVSAWWNEQRGAFVPGSSGSRTSDWYQLLEDNDGDVYAAKANPVEFDPETGFYYDPHLYDPSDPENQDWSSDSTEWTIVAVDPFGQQPCWRGDFIRCVEFDGDVSDTWGSISNYGIMQIEQRASQQLDFYGWLGSALVAGGSATAMLIMGGYVTQKTVWDDGLLIKNDDEVQALPAGTVIIAKYFPNTRQFYVVNAPCQAVQV